jgi:hypothetical protein
MRTTVRRFGAAAFATLTVGVLAAAPAFAQVGNPNFRVNPNLPLNQAGVGGAMFGQVAAQNAGFGGYNPFLAGFGAGGVNPLGSINNSTAGPGAYGLGSYYQNPYSTNYWEDPLAGFVRGVADVIGAQGQFAINIQQSRLVREQVRQAQVDTRRKIVEEWKWEQSQIPTAQDLRVRDQMLDVQRSLTNPPVTEVLEGKSLNDLLNELTKQQAKGARGREVRLDRDRLKLINVRPRGDAGNLGLLKNEGRLNWPIALRSPTFDQPRKQLDELALEAVRQAPFGSVEINTLKGMKDAVEQMHALLAANINEMKSADYMDAKRYLNYLSDAVLGLGQKDVADFFNGKNAAKGDDVGQLVDYMNKMGLEFAPAVPGEESAYRALHQAMVSFELSMGSTVVTDNK